MVSTRAARADRPLTELLYDSAAPASPLRGAFRDLYRYRSLVRLLVARDITVRYKRSILGVTWTVLNPLLMALAMWLIFNHIFRFAIPGHVPYIIYILSGILAVTYFQQGVAMTAASMVSSAGMLTKVYAPPVVFAIATACGGAVNFLFGMVPLLIFQCALGAHISWGMVLIPVPLLLLLSTIAGIGLLLSTLAIRFDDVLNLVNVLLALIAYVTPIFYPVTIVPSSFRRYFYLNPLYSYLNVFRYLEYGGARPTWLAFLIVVVSAVGMLMVGLAVFVRRWPTLAALL